MPDKSKWLVKKVSANTRELTNANQSETRYVYKGTDKDITVQAYEKDKLVEQFYLTRGINEFILDAESEGMSLRVATLPGKDSITSQITLNGEQTLITTPIEEHAEQLVAALKNKSLPESPRLKSFVDDMRNDKVLFGELKRISAFGVSHDTLCNTYCAACILLEVSPTPFGAGVCFTCTLCSSGTI